MPVEQVLCLAALLPRESHQNGCLHGRLYNQLKHAANSSDKAGNLFATIFDAIPNQTIVITPLAGVVPSAQNVIDGVRLAKPDAVFLAPPFLEQIAKDPRMLDTIRANTETVVYGGGDVSQSLGDAMAPKVQLFNFNGSTETGSFPLLRPSDNFPSQDWKYILPHPAAGLEFRPSAHGLYEVFIVKNKVYEDEQPVFKIFPHFEEFPTKDLFAPHPTKPGLWTYRGRSNLVKCAIRFPWNKPWGSMRECRLY